METVENKRIVYAFGEFVLDPAERTLFSGSVPIHLPAKEFETLLLFVQNNGKALSKEEMISSIWDDAFVEEGNLAKQISRLRKLLETNGDKYIETIPKHGYRFSADVREDPVPQSVIVQRRTVKRMAIDVEDVEMAGVTENLLPGRVTKSSWIWIPVTAGSLIAAIALYFWLFRTPSTVDGPRTISSVAVLPFKSVSTGDQDSDLKLGITDALITKLGDLRSVVVRPTNAVRKYADHEPVAAGRELGVDTVVDGNVQMAGQQMRVTVQLIDVRNGSVIWGGKFDEGLTDVFRLQDAISQQVAAALKPGLTGEEKGVLTKRYTSNPEAHHAYVQGRLLWNRRTAEDIRKSIIQFDSAIAKDPNYALAHAGRADAFSLLADYNGAPQKESYEKARESALKALELDPNLAEAHTAIAYTKMYYFWDWEGADREYRRAIELNPNYATAHQWYSEYLAGMGRFDEALTEIRRAREIDPLSPVINAGEVWILYFARRYDEAIENGRRLVQSNPEFAEIHEYLKRSFDQKGMYRDAIASRQMRRKLVGVDSTESEVLRRAASAADRQTYWQARLAQELEEAKAEGPASFDLAEIYAQLGEKDKAFEWLEKAFEQRTYTMMYLKVAPNLDSIRSDQRYVNLLGRLGFSN